MTATDNDVLVMGLQVSVPLLLSELRGMSEDERPMYLRRWGADAAEALAHRGDALHFLPAGSGRAAEVFNKLARGVAALAAFPGGATAFGLHWCTQHAGGVTPTDVAGPCEGLVPQSQLHPTRGVTMHTTPPEPAPAPAPEPDPGPTWPAGPPDRKGGPDGIPPHH